MQQDSRPAPAAGGLHAYAPSRVRTSVLAHAEQRLEVWITCCLAAQERRTQLWERLWKSATVIIWGAVVCWCLWALSQYAFVH
jgi:hypothetical protein